MRINDSLITNIYYFYSLIYLTFIVYITLITPNELPIKIYSCHNYNVLIPYTVSFLMSQNIWGYAKGTKCHIGALWRPPNTGSIICQTISQN